MEGAGGSTRHSPSLHQSYNGHRTSLLSVVPAPRGASYNGTMPTSPLASPGGPSCVSAFNCFCQSLRGFLGACYPVVPERGQHEEAVEDSTGAAAKTQLLVFRWVGGGAGWVGAGTFPVGRPRWGARVIEVWGHGPHLHHFAGYHHCRPAKVAVRRGG